MRDDERGTRYKAPADLPEGVQALVAGNKMKRQQAGGTVEWSGRRGINVTFMQTDSRCVRSDDLFRHAEHIGRRVNTIKRPVRMIIGKSLQLQTTTRPQNQNPPMRGDTFCQKQRCHAMKAGKTRYLSRRSFGISTCMGGVEGRRITVCCIRQVVSIFHVTINVTFDMPMSSMHDLEKPQKKQDQQHAHEERCRDAIDA
jgi:hypothetical protein